MSSNTHQYTPAFFLFEQKQKLYEKDLNIATKRKFTTAYFMATFYLVEIKLYMDNTRARGIRAYRTSYTPWVYYDLEVVDGRSLILADCLSELLIDHTYRTLERNIFLYILNWKVFPLMGLSSRSFRGLQPLDVFVIGPFSLPSFLYGTVYLCRGLKILRKLKLPTFLNNG